MRRQFISVNELDGQLEQEPIDDTPIMESLKKLAPWAAEIHAVDGGWMAWESVAEYRTWQQQK